MHVGRKCAAVPDSDMHEEGAKAAWPRLLNVILMRVLKRRAGTLYVGVRYFSLIPGAGRRDADKGRT